MVHNLQAITVDYRLYVVKKITDEPVSNSILYAKDVILKNGSMSGCWVSVNPHMEDRINVLSHVVSRNRDGVLQVLVEVNNDYDITKKDILFSKTQEIKTDEGSLVRLCLTKDGAKKLEHLTSNNIDGYIAKIINNEIYDIEKISDINISGMVDIPIIVTEDEIDEYMGYSSLWIDDDTNVKSDSFYKALVLIGFWFLVLIIWYFIFGARFSKMFGVLWGIFAAFFLRNTDLCMVNYLPYGDIDIVITDLLFGAVFGYFLLGFLNKRKSSVKTKGDLRVSDTFK